MSDPVTTIVTMILLWASAIFVLYAFLKHATKGTSPVTEDKTDGLLDLRRTSWTLLRSGMTMRRGFCDGPSPRTIHFPMFPNSFIVPCIRVRVRSPAIGEQK